jgi:RNA polymerase sigma-70 factor (ECF subfamily)
MAAETLAPTGRSDAQVIARSLTDGEAFGAIFDRHFDAIHGYLARRIGRQRADDLAASVFTVAFERRGGFELFAASARPWLFGIATNLLRNELRAEQRLLRQIAAAAADAHTRAQTNRASDGAVATGLAELDPDQRDVLLLYAWADLGYDEIATTLGIPIGTVRSRLARARQRMQAQLSPPKEER